MNGLLKAFGVSLLYLVAAMIFCAITGGDMGVGLSAVLLFEVMKLKYCERDN